MNPRGDGIPAIVFVEELTAPAIDFAVHHAEDERSAVFAIENSLSIGVRAFALLVHDLVIFKQILALVEVSFFAFFLGFFKLSSDHGADDGFAFGESGPLQESFDVVTGEKPHQAIIE